MWAWSLGTGYRAFSYQFAKAFPVLSKGFEIETKMSIHAVGKNLSVENEAIEYRDRFEGSKSKLNTYSDGFRVLTTIAKLFRTHKPFSFFSGIAMLLLLIAVILFVPVFSTYLQTGLVPKFPTLIVLQLHDTRCNPIFFRRTYSGRAQSQ